MEGKDEDSGKNKEQVDINVDDNSDYETATEYESSNDTSEDETTTESSEDDNPMTMEDNLDETEIAEEKFLLLKMIFPKMCPDWLKSQVGEIIRDCANVDDKEEKNVRIEKMFWMKVEEFFSLSPEELDSLPSIQDWKEKKTKQEEMDMITNLTVENLIRIYGDMRNHRAWEIPEVEYPLFRDQCIEFLKQKHPKQSLPVIQRMFRGKRYLALIRTDETLSRNHQPTRKTKRAMSDIRFPEEQSLAFLKERRLLELQTDMRRYEMEIERKQNERAREVAMAEMLLRCTCCLSSPLLLPRELIFCPVGHGYCRKCIDRSALEVMAVGSARGVVECLATGCKKEIGMDDLENILDEKVLFFLKQRRQTAEILASRLQDVVTCPFCPYMVVMEDPNDKILKCLNPDCSQDSCRRCQEPEHCPLSCDEVAPLIKRKKVEEELTMSVVRQCWKCKVDFMKTVACPQMTCPRCGADTCYACRKEWGTGRDHMECDGEYTNTDSEQKARHDKELAAAQERIKDEMEDVPDDIKDLLEAGPSSRK